MASAPETTTIELGDVQSNALRGFRIDDAFPHVAYLFLKLGDLASARAWLAAITPQLTSCADWDALAGKSADARFAWNVAFTYQGLRTLGLPGSDPDPEPMDPAECRAFDSAFRDHDAFVEGAVRRASYLGDENESAPEHWQQHFKAAELHALISLSAATPAGLVAVRERFEAALAQHPGAAKPLGVESGAGRKDHREHFGFVDGIGQPDVAQSGLPVILGGGTPTKTGWQRIPAGEFVLGYPNTLEQPAPNDSLLRNGSFLAFRKLRQDVAAFRAFVSQNAKRTKQAEELLAARLFGRWQSGAPLALAALRDDPALGKDAQRNNDFGFADDGDGFTTPFGAHIRRANPRNDPTGPTTNQTAAHRIIRRATPYGVELAAGASDDGADRGVLFVVVNADIERQFEFVQANWLNSTLSSRRLTHDADRDPIVGANDGTGKFLIPGANGPTLLWALPRFITVRGAAYFFLPGLAALRRIAAGDFENGQPVVPTSERSAS